MIYFSAAGLFPQKLQLECLDLRYAVAKFLNPRLLLPTLEFDHELFALALKFHKFLNGSPPFCGAPSESAQLGEHALSILRPLLK